MLTCIASTKQLTGGSLQDDGVARIPKSVKSLTSQIKDMAIKASGAYKNRKPCSRSANENREFDINSMSDQLCGRTTESVVFMEEDGPKEWVAQVEPGVLIIFVSMPQGGGNHLKRIRFSRELFNKWQAQRWWADKYENIMELYNVQRFSDQTMPLSGPLHESSKIGPLKTDLLRRNLLRPNENSRDSIGLASNLMSSVALKTETSFAVRRSGSSRETADGPSEFSVSNASDVETEWVEQDEPGVYVTIRQLLDGTRELRRVRFSREKFGENHARLWWEENKARIQEQYL